MWITVFHYKLVALLSSYTVFRLFSLYFIYTISYFIYSMSYYVSFVVFWVCFVVFCVCFVVIWVFLLYFVYAWLYFVHAWLYFTHAWLYFVKILTYMAIFAWLDKTCYFYLVSKGLRTVGIPLFDEMILEWIMCKSSDETFASIKDEVHSKLLDL